MRVACDFCFSFVLVLSHMHMMYRPRCGIGVHAIDMWKQDASWKKLRKIKLEMILHLTNQQNSYLHCISTTKNVVMRCVLRAQNA